MTVLLYKHKMDGDTEYSPVYFNSATKTVINFLNIVLINLSKRFYTAQIIGLLKDLVG